MFSRKQTSSAKDQVTTVEAATEGSSGYPKDYSISAIRERRQLMALRAMTIAFFLSAIANIVQAFTLVSILPLKEFRPFLIQLQDEASVVAQIRPIDDTFDAKDLLTEKLIREYVVNRHEILLSDEVMMERWQPRKYMGVTSSAQVYEAFSIEVTPVLTQIREAGIQRRVVVKSVSAVKLGKVYLVDFQVISRDQTDKVIEDQLFTATLEIDFLPLKDLTREQMLINPTGFQVVNYSLAEKQR